MLYYEIAGLKFRVVGADGEDGFKEPMQAYETAEFTQPDIDVHFTAGEVTLPPGAEPGRGDFIKYDRREGGCLFYSGTEDLGVTNLAQVSGDWSRIDITIKPIGEDEPTGIRLFHMLGRAVELCMAAKGRMVFHSSSIAYKGHGICFSEISGMGKSTHTGLWLKEFGSDVILVNDDKPILRFEEDRTILCGSPWAGTTGINTNVTVPLDAVVCLCRGSENRLWELEETEAVLRIIKESPRPYTQELMEMFLDRVSDLVQRTKVYMLQCDISSGAVKEAFKCLDTTY